MLPWSLGRRSQEVVALLRARVDNVALNVVVAMQGESRVVSAAALEVSLMGCSEVMSCYDVGSLKG